MKKSKTLFTHTALISSVLSGVLYADTLTVGGTNSPTLTITGNSMSTDLTGSNAIWSSSNKGSTTSIKWVLENGIYKIQDSTTNVRKKGLEFSFRSTNNEGDNSVVSYGSYKEKVGFVINSNANQVSLDLGDRGLDASGYLGLYINFGSGNNVTSNKTFTVSTTSTIKGGITINGGAGNNKYIINADSIEGDIVFMGGKIDDCVGSTITITKSLIGNIATTGTMGRNGTQSDFQDSNGQPSENNGVSINLVRGAKMIGDIKGYGVGYDSLKRMVTFSDGSGKVFDGNVFSYGTNSKTGIGFDRSAGNHVTFKNGDMTGSFVATTGNGMGGQKGYNNITFSSGDVQTLVGGILSEDNGAASGQATNTLNIENGTILRMIANNGENSTTTIRDENTACYSSGDNNSSCTIASGTTGNFGTTTKEFTLTSGSIIAKGYSIAEVNLGANATLSLNNGLGSISLQDITPIKNQDNNRAKANITFKGTNGKIDGEIDTGVGITTIQVDNSASGTITGSIKLGKKVEEFRLMVLAELFLSLILFMESTTSF